ncbi:MAG: class I SAM-dependent methyltransferase [Coriobacteriales bacterium]|nr:class I SAM-dependent methyltransferase [Coriobacteriales bacterium]
MAFDDAKQEFFVRSGRGLENLLAAELKTLGVAKPRPLASGVAFFGSLELGLRVCLWSRQASRVLLILDRVDATDSDTLYRSVQEICWEEHIAADARLAVQAQGLNDQLRNSQFVGQRVKDAIVDRIRQAKGRRPDVDSQRPDVLVNVLLRQTKATIAIDLSGEPLHRRAYRVPSPAIVAPLRETLAASMLAAAGWGLSTDKPKRQGATFRAAVDNQQATDEDPGYQQPARTGTNCQQAEGDTDLPAAALSCNSSQQTAVNDSKKQIPKPSLSFVCDPLCGSGTIAIEAALIASDRAPGLLRDYWGFSGWLGFDGKLWQALLDEADERAEQRLSELRELSQPLVLASDIDSQALQVALTSAKRAGVEKLIDFTLADVGEYRFPAVLAEQRGLLATNPPYGQRLATTAQLPALYAALGGLVKSHSGRMDAAIITPDDLSEAYLNAAFGSAPSLQLPTMSGPLSTTIRVWREEVAEPSTEGVGNRAQKKSASVKQTDNTYAQPETQINQPGYHAQLESPTNQPGSHTQSEASSNQPDHSALLEAPDKRENQNDWGEDRKDSSSLKNPSVPLATDFANRLTKMARHREKWARRAGVNCYRLYDADLPDYNVSIDLYQGAANTADAEKRWLSITEYRAPAEIDLALANARLAEVLRIAPAVLGIATDQVFFHRREKSKGGSQYSQADFAGNSAVHLIEEDGLLFEVDLASRLDSGIFLDHRITRSMLRQMALEQDCLNLFAYTGTASVYMAAGGAKSVTTVDLSRPYLNWAERNMSLNSGRIKASRRNLAMSDTNQPELQFIQADVLRWLHERRALTYTAGNRTTDNESHSTSKGKSSQSVKQEKQNRPLEKQNRQLEKQNLQLEKQNRQLEKQNRSLASKPEQVIRSVSVSKPDSIPRRFGLIFVDVPTFSNSNRMGDKTWDVQRDHVELLIAVSRLLTRDGLAVFSTNFRSFKPDLEQLSKAKVALKDISATTLPPDFKRRARIHSCYLVSRMN